jgi:hypothetical protein
MKANFTPMAATNVLLELDDPTTSCYWCIFVLHGLLKPVEIND